MPEQELDPSNLSPKDREMMEVRPEEGVIDSDDIPERPSVARSFDSGGGLMPGGSSPKKKRGFIGGIRDLFK